MSFGDVRSLLNQPPSAGAWEALCALLDAFSPDALDAQVLPYVEGMTRRWPEALCVAPQRWVLDVLAGTHRPFWSIVRALDLSCLYLTPEQILTLLADAQLERVNLLAMSSNRIGPEGARILAARADLGQLHTLDLGFNGLKVEGARALKQAQSFGGLRALVLDSNGLGGAGLRALASASWWRQLERLDLRDNKLDTESMARGLAKTPRLRAVKLDHNTIGVGRLGQVLGACDETMRLHTLELRYCNLDDRDVELLCNTPATSSLERLDLSRNAISVRGARALASSPLAHTLTALYLDAGPIERQGCEALASMPALRRVGLGPRGHAQPFAHRPEVTVHL